LEQYRFIILQAPLGFGISASRKISKSKKREASVTNHLNEYRVLTSTSCVNIIYNRILYMRNNKPLSIEGAENLGIEYVRQRENCGDVIIDSCKLTLLGGLHIYEVKGKVKRHAIEKDTGYDAIVMERYFEVHILALEKTVCGYSKSAWINITNIYQSSSSPEQAYQEPTYYCAPEEGFTYTDIKRKKDLEDSKINLNRARSKYYRNRTPRGMYDDIFGFESDF